MAKKSDALDRYRVFSAWVRTQFKTEIKTFHSDRGGEFTHDTPELNGVAERLNATLANLARSMLFASELPKFLWSKALEEQKRTPFEMLYGSKPNLNRARGFGCKVFVKTDATSKLDEKAAVGRWIGISGETKGGNFVYWPEKRKVTVERNVRFVDGTVFAGEEDTEVTTTVPIPALERSHPYSSPTTSISEPETKQNQSTLTTLPSPQVAVDPIANLDGDEGLSPPGRAQRQRKPSAYVRQLIAQGDKVPWGIQLPNTVNTRSDMRGPSDLDPWVCDGSWWFLGF